MALQAAASFLPSTISAARRPASLGLPLRPRQVGLYLISELEEQLPKVVGGPRGKWHVTMACRDFLKAERAAKSAGMNKDSYDVMHLDLASLDSVRQFVDNFRNSGKPLDALVCNAAVYLPTAKEPTFTADGFELSVGVNHLGHYLLSRLMLEDLNKSDYPSRRLIIVGSITGNTTRWQGTCRRRRTWGTCEGSRGADRAEHGLHDQRRRLRRGQGVQGQQGLQHAEHAGVPPAVPRGDGHHLRVPLPRLHRHHGALQGAHPLFRLLFPPFQKYITKGFVSEEEAGKRLAQVRQLPSPPPSSLSAAGADLYFSLSLLQVVGEPSLTKSGVYWSWNQNSASFENQLSEEASDPEKARRVWELSEKLVGLA
ncbi:unnamed protein product [Spirodela intermedia]|uniref:protochlorophyllide reductase n=1 Tax=Spirodela intermedia TaxID=51605 RepID=A0A7I8ID11_SPIIN|nr:unnamed protein product [Spirodela intermedia]CAA6655688.1 unnamed protein product [Spirodela intermedia]